MSIVRVKSNKNRIKDRVLVLLSSYNGEKYIREQLDSLMTQTMPAFILIRDDGSTDGTVPIIKEYIKKYDNIKLMEGKNLGFVGSFNTLVLNELVDKYEWIAFCDQDDVWLPEKLSAAVDMLKKDYDSEVPTLYCSNFTAADRDLKPLGSLYNMRSFKDRNPITYHYVFGCTCVFNYAAATMYRVGINDFMVFHDKHLHCVCYYFGRIVYDNNSYILYRQHGFNTVSCYDKAYIRGVIDVVSEVFAPKEKRWVACYREFRKKYDKYLTYNDRKLLDIFINHQHSLICRLRIFFGLDFCGRNFKHTVAFKLRALLNRMY